jgi:sugar lactone lactonase YvrE
VPLRGSLRNISPDAKWNKNGQTVAGQNQSLRFPYGLFVHDDQTIYVADYQNHRIMAWRDGEMNGQVVAGGYGEGKGAHQLHYPTDVIVDKQTDSLIICDHGNKRVVRWPRRNGTSGETIISNIACYGLTMDEQASLYVTDASKHEVRRYQRGESQGTIVAGGNGPGDRSDQLCSPSYVFVDKDHSMFVCDCSNHRVMKWIEGAKEGMAVAWGQGPGNSLSQLSFPRGVLVDQLGTVYVADGWNNQIFRWPKGAQQGNIIIGGNGHGAQANQLYGPMGLSFDRHGHLYVTDWKNNRVQRFNIELPSN